MPMQVICPGMYRRVFDSYGGDDGRGGGAELLRAALSRAPTVEAPGLVPGIETVPEVA